MSFAEIIASSAQDLIQQALKSCRRGLAFALAYPGKNAAMPIKHPHRSPLSKKDPVMPVRTSLERVGKSEFFAIMAPGFYIFVGVTILATALLEHEPASSVWRRFITAWHPTAQLWFLAFGVLFFSYLLGNMLRALPVDLADTWAVRLRLNRPFQEFFKKDYGSSEGFPYPTVLHEVAQKLISYQNLSQISFLPARPAGHSEKVRTEADLAYERHLHDLFNYWKMVLCQGGEPAFAFTQELEARVRLFAGMFWAGAVGLLIVVVGTVLILLPFHNLDPNWERPLCVFAALSILLCVLFAHELRRVRKHEVRQLFTAYVAFVKLHP